MVLRNYLCITNDTDSIHLNYDDVHKIVERYKPKHNQEVVGEDLRNVHVDFDIDGACGEIYAKEHLFLGKQLTLIY